MWPIKQSPVTARLNQSRHQIERPFRAELAQLSGGRMRDSQHSSMESLAGSRLLDRQGPGALGSGRPLRSSAAVHGVAHYGVTEV